MTKPTDELDALCERLRVWPAPSSRDCREAADAITSLRETVAELEAVLERAQAAMWDSHYGKGIAVEYAQAVDAEINNALARKP